MYVRYEGPGRRRPTGPKEQGRGAAEGSKGAGCVTETRKTTRASKDSIRMVSVPVGLAACTQVYTPGSVKKVQAVTSYMCVFFGKCL